MKSIVYELKKQEFAIVFSVLTAILLPVRLIFYTYFSTNWFGSLGVISVVSIILLILLRKGKLGRFGEMFARQMIKDQVGKRGIIVYGSFALPLVFFSLLIFCFNVSSPYDEKNTVAKMIEYNNNGTFPTMDKLVEKDVQEFKNKGFENKMNDMVSNLAFFRDNFGQVVYLVGDINWMTSGYTLHFITVFFVEDVEELGILLFFRYVFLVKNKQKLFERNLIIPEVNFKC